MENFRDTLVKAREELATKLRERDAAEIRIAQLKRIIAGVSDYVDETEETEQLFEITESSLKGAIRTAVRAIGRAATVTDVRNMLNELRFPIEEHQNPSASIKNVLTRLIADGEVSHGTPRDGRKTYVWVLPIYGAASSLANQLEDARRDKERKRKKWLLREWAFERSPALRTFQKAEEELLAGKEPIHALKDFLDKSE